MLLKFGFKYHQDQFGSQYTINIHVRIEMSFPLSSFTLIVILKIAFFCHYVYGTFFKVRKYPNRFSLKLSVLPDHKILPPQPILGLCYIGNMISLIFLTAVVFDDLGLTSEENPWGLWPDFGSVRKKRDNFTPLPGVNWAGGDRLIKHSVSFIKTTYAHFFGSMIHSIYHTKSYTYILVSSLGK